MGTGKKNDAAWYQFREWIEYFAVKYGKITLAVSPNGHFSKRFSIQNFFSETDFLALGNLPLPLANAVMQDAQKRFRVSTLHCDYPAITEADIQLQLDSVQPVTWNLCHGGVGPTKPAMGTCPDVSLSGWRMIVLGELRGESWQWVYYIPQDAQPGIWNPEPDGLQSFPAPLSQMVL